MKKVRFWLLFILVISLMTAVFTGCDNETRNSGREEITIGKSAYSYSWIPIYIFENIGEELGYSINISEGDMGFLWLGLSNGDIDVLADVWLPTLHKNYMEKYGDKIDLVHTILEDDELGWGVPSYVDINSIADLKGKGAQFNDRIVGMEPSSGMMLTSEEALKAYDLEDEYSLVQGSTSAMLAETERAYQAKEPIVMVAWRPHTMMTRYDLKILEDPKNVWTFDDWHTGANPGLEEKAPDFYRFISHFEITADEIEEMLFEFEEGAGTVEQLRQMADKWIMDNRETVDKWIEE